MDLDRLNNQAGADGIGTLREVRDGLIELRNRVLVSNMFEDAVFLTHAIWWLSTIRDEAEAGRPE